MSESLLEISNILNYLLKSMRLSEAELARNVNIPRATINRLVSGKTPDPRASTLNAIAEYFNISVDQLLGKKPIFLAQIESNITPKQESIPVLNIEDCRDWDEIIHQLTNDSHFDWVSIDPTIEKGKFAVRVQGESMWPQFDKDTILIISPESEPKNRDFVIAYIKKSGDILFRQLIIENRYKFLRAINTMFPAISLEPQDVIIGVVIQIRKTYS